MAIPGHTWIQRKGESWHVMRFDNGNPPRGECVAACVTREAAEAAHRLSTGGVSRPQTFIPPHQHSFGPKGRFDCACGMTPEKYGAEWRKKQGTT